MLQEMQDITQQNIQNINENNLQQKACRICLSNENNQDIIAPCKCTGSIKYIHEKCLLQWVTKSKTKAQRVSIFQWATKCQLCNQIIGLTGKLTCQCFNKDKLIQRIQSNIGILFFLVVLHALNIILFVYLLTLIGQFETFYFFISLLYTVSLIALGFLILLAWALATFQFLVRIQTKIYSVNKAPKFENFHSQASIFPQ